MQGPVPFIGLEGAGWRQGTNPDGGWCVCVFFFFFLKKPLFTNQDPSFIWKGYFYDHTSLFLPGRLPYELYESFSVCFYPYFLGRTAELHTEK